MGEFAGDLDAACCNLIEPEGTPCPGMMRAGWPTFRCDTCGAMCGAMVHPTHVTPTTDKRNDEETPDA